MSAAPVGRAATLLLLAAMWGPVPVRAADEPAVTVLADFEDDSVAASIGAVTGALAADCSVAPATVPARGQRSLALDIGATAAGATVTCELLFRVPVRFSRADRVTGYFRLKEGSADVALQLLDARGRLLETPVQKLVEANRWIRVTADLSSLRVKGGDDGPAWPLQARGFRATSARVGRQTVYFDDLQVEHRVGATEIVGGDLAFNEPTKIYQPGSDVAAAVVLENRSRVRDLKLNVELTWTRPDGTTLTTQRASVNLPKSGDEFRSRQRLDFTQRIDAPGFYRVAVAVRASDWPRPGTFSTTIAVTPTNRDLPRGRSTFCGLRSNLLREPLVDRRLEIEVARALGVHLLCIEAPWSVLEPKRGSYDFGALDPLVEALVARNIAPAIAIRGAPEWVAEGQTAGPAELLAALARHYGDRVQHYLLPPLETSDAGARAKQTAAAREAVRAAQPRALVLPPAADALTLEKLPEDGGPILLETAGDSAAACAALERLLDKAGKPRGGPVWWQHRSAPLTEASATYYADAIFRQFVRAAALGCEGLIWADLRDDDNDPRAPELQNGLVQRDFSPKAALVGYATAVGALTGVRYAGPVFGTPDAFDSALLVGSEYQIAALLPRVSRALPALLTPIQGVPGTLELRDLERSPLLLLESQGPPLMPVTPTPQLLVLRLESAQPEPQLALTPAWLRVPRSVYCREKATLAVEIDAPFNLQSSYMKLTLPDGAPLKAGATTRALVGAAGQTIRGEIELTAAGGPLPEATQLGLRVSVESHNLDWPVDVHFVRAVKPPTTTGAAHEIALLRGGAADNATTAGRILANYTPEQLLLVIETSDDRIVPEIDGAAGDRLRVGLAAENDDERLEFAVQPAAGGPRLQPLTGTPSAVVQQIRVRSGEAAAGQQRVELVIPAKLLGAEPLTAGRILRLAVVSEDVDDARAAPTTARWGGGLDGSGITERYGRIELVR